MANEPLQILAYGAQQTVGPVEVPYDILNPQLSTTADAVATGGTISTSGVTVARVAPTAAVTGVILEPGEYPGKRLTVVNEAASADSVTFAAAGTSNVALGTSAVIAGQASLTLTWNPFLGLWM